LLLPLATLMTDFYYRLSPYEPIFINANHIDPNHAANSNHC
jgi:hypothetical protein